MRIFTLVLFSLSCAAGLAQAAAAPAHAPDMPGRPAGLVYSEGGQLWVDGQPYRFSANNSYSALQSNDDMDKLLAGAAALGLNAVRIWAYSNGESPNYEGGYMVFNQTPTSWPPHLSYGEDRWRQLDYALKRAADYHIRLILTLGNYWDDTGVFAMARWTTQLGANPQGNDREQFYRLDRAKQVYASFVEHMANRVNTYTGITYKNDSTILLYEPMNEARGRTDASGQTVSAWLNWAATTIKTYDPNHLVGTGTEGFIANYVPGVNAIPGFDYNQYAFQTGTVNHLSRYNPETHQNEDVYTPTEGTDFVLDCSQPAIDVCSLHAWPEQWFIADASNPALFMQAWIQAHVDLMALHQINKPLYLAEFGASATRGSDHALSQRDAVYQSAYSTAAANSIAGIGFWLQGFTPVTWLNGHSSLDVLCNQDTWDSTCSIIGYYSKALHSQAPVVTAP